MINTSSRFTERQFEILSKIDVSADFRRFLEKLQNGFDWNDYDCKDTLTGIDEDERPWKLSYRIQMSEHSGVTPVVSLSCCDTQVAFWGAEQGDQRYFAMWWSCVSGIAFGLHNDEEERIRKEGEAYFNNQ